MSKFVMKLLVVALKEIKYGGEQTPRLQAYYIRSVLYGKVGDKER